MPKITFEKDEKKYERTMGMGTYAQYIDFLDGLQDRQNVVVELTSEDATLLLKKLLKILVAKGTITTSDFNATEAKVIQSFYR